MMKKGQLKDVVFWSAVVTLIILGLLFFFFVFFGKL
jgi:hypothetical protein